MHRLSMLGAILLPLAVTGVAGAQSRPGIDRVAGGIVTGTVQAPDGAPVPSASVVLRRSRDTLPVLGSTSDSAGAFRITGVPPGSYTAEIRRIGFRMATREGVTVSAPAGALDLGVIRLQPSAVTLASVAVRAAPSQITVLPDRTVYATSRMPVAAGGTATDVLRSIPELQVSIDGTVTTRGATPRIYINGRPAPMQGESLDRYLQQLPAERIERVEVIANPGARYEADGQGGIVNIVMKRGSGAGLSGGVAASAGTQNQQTASGSLNYRRGKLSLFGNGSASFSRGRSVDADLRQNLSVQPTTYLQLDSRNLNSADMADVGLAAELQVGRRGTLWVDAGAGHNPTDASALAAYTYLDDLKHPTARYDRVNDTRLRGRFGRSSVGYRTDAGTGGNEWSVELRQGDNVVDHTGESERRWLTPDGASIDMPPDLTFADQGQDQRNRSLDASVARRWGASGRVEAGYRGSLRQTGDDFRMSVDSGAAGAQDDAAGDFRQREVIHAAFVSASDRFGRFDVQAGVRGERADTRRTLPLTGEVFASAYRRLFPSATVSTALGDGGQLSLSYAERVDRPWGGILDPVVPNLDPLNRQVGNPRLAPRHTRSLGLTATRTGRLGMLQLTPYYRRTVDSWDQVRTVDTAGVSTVTWENLATISSYGATATASLSSAGRVAGFLSVSGAREVRDASNLRPEFSGSSTQLSVTSTASVRATAALSLEGFLTYLPAHDVPQGRISPLVFSSLGARHQLPGGRGAVTLSVVDPFQLQHFTFTTRDRTHVQVGSSTYSARRATLGVSYTFGRSPRRKGRSSKEDSPQQSQGPVIR